MNHDEWSLLIHPNSGRKYFYNIKSGESRWNLQAIGGPYSSYDTDPLLTNNLTHRHTNANARQRYHSLNQDGFDEKAVKYNRPGKLSFMTPPRERRLSFPGQHAPNSQQQSLSAVAKHRKTHTIKSPNNFIARDDALDRKYTIGQTQQGSGLRTLLPLSVGDVINVTQSSDTKSRPMLDNYNKDYIALSKEYHLMERFRVNPCSSSPDLEYTPTCVMCKRGGKRLKVLFPCEHVCACGSCLESSLSKRCPVCNEIIRVVFDHDGNAHENYMRWAEEVSISFTF
jgi:hypothetical protein